MEFYAGTLTREGGEGILRICVSGGLIERTHLIGGLTDPNYLILSPDGKRLYAVSSDAESADCRGCVNEFDLTRPDTPLISRQPTHGTAPCHLTLSPDGRYLYCANYGTGSLVVFPAADGLRPSVLLLRHTGTGPDPVRQAGPHVHQVYFLSERLLCAADLGSDALWLYPVSPQDGLPGAPERILLSGGPRHIVRGRGGAVYLAHELSSEVTVLKRDGDTLFPVQTLSTLPDGCAERNLAAAIRLSADGRTLYVSNRGHGSIAAFSVGATGLLTQKGHIPAGEYPRDFLPLPQGGFLVADQHSGILLIDKEGRVQSRLEQKGAVCVCPVPA